MPTSWLRQSAFLHAELLHLARRADAGVVFGLADMEQAAELLVTSEPELIEITGMPAATAFFIDAPSAAASGIETTRPSGLEATAASISCAISTMSKVSGDGTRP